MGRARDPKRDKAFKIYRDSGGKVSLIDIAKQLEVGDGTVRGWKFKDDWKHLVSNGIELPFRQMNAPKEKKINKPKRTGMKNDYEIRGSITVIFLRRRSGEIIETIIDTKDLEWVNQHNGSWCAHWAKNVNNYYVESRKKDEEGNLKPLYLHRYLLSPPDEMVVDHINHNTLDNRSSNIRICSVSSNTHNMSGPRKNGTSGRLCVHWVKGSKKWKGQIVANGVTHYLGMFADIEDADRAVKEARKKYMPCSREASDYHG